jgi:hypothetical protein
MTGRQNSGKGAAMKQYFAPAAALALLALAACADDDDNAPAMYCPPVAVLAQASTLTQYLPGRTDIGAELTTATLTGVAGSCTLNKKKHELTVSFKAGFSATNGPANHGQTVTLPYFVALTNGDDIIGKSLYSIAVPFDGNVSTATATSKPIKAIFPNIPDNINAQILVAFQSPQP